MDINKIKEKLKSVKDPEIGYDVISLGLIYDITIEGKKVIITMTLTTPMCPYGPVLIADVEKAVRELGYEVEVNVVFDPPWGPDKIDPEIREILGI